MEREAETSVTVRHPPLRERRNNTHRTHRNTLSPIRIHNKKSEQDVSRCCTGSTRMCLGREESVPPLTQHRAEAVHTHTHTHRRFTQHKRSARNISRKIQLTPLHTPHKDTQACADHISVQCCDEDMYLYDSKQRGQPPAERMHPTQTSPSHTARIAQLD